MPIGVARGSTTVGPINAAAGLVWFPRTRNPINRVPSRGLHSATGLVRTNQSAGPSIAMPNHVDANSAPAFGALTAARTTRVPLTQQPINNLNSRPPDSSNESRSIVVAITHTNSQAWMHR